MCVPKNKFIDTKFSLSPSNSQSCSSPKRRRLSSPKEVLWISPTPISAKTNLSIISPSKHLQSLLLEHGIINNITPAFSLEEYFLTPLDEHFSSYQEDVISALRKRDIKSLRKKINEGRSLQCCNRFGESLIHMACRRSFGDVVSFLIKEGSVSLKVRDDYGRTPMHDAFWTAKPNLELVKILILKEPSLLFVSDKRGHTPLDYVRRSDWEVWNAFLECLIPVILEHIQ